MKKSVVNIATYILFFSVLFISQSCSDDSNDKQSLDSPIGKFEIIGEPQVSKSIKLLLDADIPLDDVEITCLSGSEPIDLNVNSNYTITASDIGHYIQCKLTSLDEAYSTLTPFLGVIHNGELTTNDESVSSDIFHSIAAGNFNETTRPVRFMNSTVVFKGETYFVYVDGDLYPIVGKVDRGGIVTTARLDSDDDYKVYEESHHQFTIGIDELGYIHIAGDMHNYSGLTLTTDEMLLPSKYQGQRLLMWRSANPQAINSFKFTGGNTSKAPVGTGFSYTNFVSGMNGELILRARLNLIPNGWFAGKRGWGFYIYDSETSAWNEIHGTVDSAVFDGMDTPSTTFLWEDNGHSGGAYQGFTSGVKFDLNNTIHVSSTINNDNAMDEATHLIYARSDDLGQTWKKATGEEIETLPLRVDAGSGQADIVLNFADYPEFSDGLWSRAFLSNKQNGDPCIIYAIKDLDTVTTYGTQRYQCFDSVEQRWSAPMFDPTGGVNGTDMLEDINGLALFVHNSDFGSIFRSFDHMSGYQVYLDGAKSNFLGLDSRSVLENNNFVSLVRDRKTGDLNLTSTKFIPADSIKGALPSWWNEHFYTNSTGESFVINNVMNLSGVGSPATYDSKDFQYVYQNIEAKDFEIKMRVRNLDTQDQSAFSGIMLSENLDTDGKFYAFYIKHDEGLVRTHNYGSALEKAVFQETVFLSEWIKVSMIDGVLTLYQSDNNETWNLVHSEELSEVSSKYVGIIKGATKQGNYTRIDNIQLSQFEE